MNPEQLYRFQYRDRLRRSLNWWASSAPRHPREGQMAWTPREISICKEILARRLHVPPAVP